MDKSWLTLVIAISLCVAGFLLPGFAGEIVLNTGLYSFTGAVTDSIAIYMLFEKVPGIYGSGVIPARFTEFRAGIRVLVMEQFFSAENVHKVLASISGDGNALVEKLLPRLDFNKAFDTLVEVIMESGFGTALSMFGGANRLQGLREPFVVRMQDFLRSVGEDPGLFAEIAGHNSDALLRKVEYIVDQRLEQMTPQMVKEIMQKMIKEHLGWLVVWGGVVGGLLGLGVVLVHHWF